MHPGYRRRTGLAIWRRTHFAEGRIVGRIRSGGYGYSVDHNIGLAYLPPELAAKGTRLEVELFGERVRAEVTADVLYDPQGARLRA
ncbi:MAG: hypothetical protein HS114_13075 [Anaerolineales bacterium]|nr:hypothetical protein [Anaerolineales bacterium]